MVGVTSRIQTKRKENQTHKMEKGFNFINLERNKDRPEANGKKPVKTEGWKQ